VYQAAYLQILGSAISAANRKRGFAFNDGFSSRSAIFNILIAILDYEEAWVLTPLPVNPLLMGPIRRTRATSILGANSTYTCPICLVPRGELWDLSQVIYPRRARDGALQLLANAHAAPSKKAAKEILATQSIRNVAVRETDWTRDHND
jgi:hypothetical protein